MAEHYNLNNRVEAFLEKYEEQVVIPSGKPINKRIASAKMRDFIEKMAVWYELAYPTREAIDGLAAPSLDLDFFINSLSAYEKKILMATGREFGIGQVMCQSIRKSMLDCVMYRLIERGNNKLGARRALKFAEEFDCDIHVPIMYGLNTNDVDSRDFIEKYLALGGNEKLLCYDGYLKREKDSDILKVFSLDTYLETLPRTGEVTQKDTVSR